MAQLVIDGAGNASVTAPCSGAVVERTFTPFPTDLPGLFNFGADKVNDHHARLPTGDDIAPLHVLDSTIGGNHGYRAGRLTVLNHGFSADDQGKVYTAVDGADYMLVRVDAPHHLVMVHMSGEVTPPIGNYSLGGSPAFTATSRGLEQWLPPFERHKIRAFVDAEPVNGAGSWIYRDCALFVESYDLLSRSEMLAWCAASKGQGAPNGAPSFRVTNTYRYDVEAQLSIVTNITAIQSGVKVGDVMGLQFARKDVQSYYVPNALPVDGLDYANIVSANAHSASVEFTPAHAREGAFLDRVIALNGGAYLACGFLSLPVTPAGDTRRDLCTERGLEIRGDTGKVYFRMVDKGDFTMDRGESFTAVGYRNVMPAITGKTAAYPVRTGGERFFFVDWHDRETIDQVDLPPDFAGSRFDVVYSRNATPCGTALGGAIDVQVTAPSDHAFLVLRAR